MLRRYYRDLCAEAILAEIGRKTLRRYQRLMMRVLTDTEGALTKIGRRSDRAVLWWCAFSTGEAIR